MEEKQDVWAIVEIMGHDRYAGRVSEFTRFGPPLTRVEVPGEDGQIKWEKYFGPGAIYAITPVDEATARLEALRCSPTPITVYSAPVREPVRALDHEEYEEEDEED